MKRSSSGVTKAKLYSANQINPRSYLQFDYFKPKPDAKQQEANVNQKGDLEQKGGIAGYKSGKGGDLYTRTRNCLYHNASATGSSIYTPNANNAPSIQNKSIPKRSNLDKLILSLKSEILELSKNIQTTPSAASLKGDIINNRPKTSLLVQDKNMTRKGSYHTSDNFYKPKSSVIEIEDCYYNNRMEFLKAKNESNNNNRYIEDSLNKKALTNNFSSSPINTTNNNMSNALGPAIPKDKATPIKLQSPPYQNLGKTSEISSAYHQRDDSTANTHTIKALVEKNRQLEENVSSLEAKLQTANGIIADLMAKNHNADKAINDLNQKVKQMKEKEELESYSIQPYPCNFTLKEKQKDDSALLKIEEELKAEINELTEENKRLTDVNHSNNIAYSENINQLKRSNEAYIDDIKAKADVIAKGKEDLVEVTKENTILNDKMNEMKDDYEKRLRNIQATLLSKDKEIASLMSNFQLNQEALIKEQSAQMQLQLDSVTKENAKLSMVLKKKDTEQYAEIEELTRESTQLKCELNQLKQLCADKEATEAKESKAHEDSIAKLKETIESFQRDNRTQSNSLNENNAIILSMKKAIAFDKALIDQLKEENESLTKANQSSIDDISNEHNRKYLQLQKEHSSLTNEFQKKTAEFNQLISSLLEEKEFLNSKVSSLQEDKAALFVKDTEHSKLIDDYKRQSTQAEGTMTKLKGDNTQLNKELTDKTKEIIAMKERLRSEDHVKDKEKLQNDYNALLTAFDKYKKEHINHQSQVEVLKEMNEKQKEKIDLMTQSAQEESEALANLQEESRRLHKDNDDLFAEMEVLKRNNDSVQVIIADLNRQILNYKSILDQKDCDDKERVEALKDSVSSLQVQLEKMTKEKEDLRNQLLIEKEAAQKSIIHSQMLQQEKDELISQLASKDAIEKSLDNKVSDLNTAIAKSQEDYLRQIEDLAASDKQKAEQIAKMHQTLIELNKANDSLNQKLSSMVTDDPLSLSSYRSPQEIEEIDSLYKTIAQCKETILILEKDLKAKDDLFKEKDEEIDQYKGINSKLLLSIESIQSKLTHSGSNSKTPLNKPNDYLLEDNEGDTIDQELVENLKMTIDNLRELVIEKEKQITELLSQKDIIAEKKSNTSMTMADAEKCEQYRKRIDDYKAQLQTEIQQNSLLKEEIKDMNRRFLLIQSYEGKIRNYEEFLQQWVIAFEGFKPKGAEKKEAFFKLREHLTGYDPESREVEEDTEKKSILSKIFKSSS